MSSVQRTLMKSRLPPVIPASSRNGIKSDRHGGRKRDYTPVQWNNYFTIREDVQTESGTFRVYSSPVPERESPLLLMLHGGGFSALTWSHFCTSVIDMIHCQVMAIDLRGHGDTVTSDDTDLSAETLASDVEAVILSLFSGKTTPNIFLVGHSMGGAVAVHISSRNLIPSLIGVAVIDVVEGTAMEALASMQSILRSRPTHFKTIENAIEWSVRSGQIRNLDSAKVSMPGQIINIESGKLATNELVNYESTSALTDDSEPMANPSRITEEAEELDGVLNPVHEFKKPVTTDEGLQEMKKYGWRIDLAKTEQHWSGWFKGMSELFLGLSVPKLLILASIDGLDRTLTVGQMQGKFQMIVLARCGHAVHEDRPNEVAEVISSFLLRHKFTESKSEFTNHMPAC